MTLYDEHTGIKISLKYDGEGFPLVDIDLGGNFYGENERPTVEVNLNRVQIHEMFDEVHEVDKRWVAR